MIRVSLAAIGAALAVGVVWGGAASAQIPGSYLDSCRAVRMSGPILNAECRGSGERTYSTTLDTSRCRGAGIANTFGRLTCGGVQGSANEISGGSYDDGQLAPRYGAPVYAPAPPRYGQLPPPPAYRPSYGYAPPPPAPDPVFDQLARLHDACDAGDKRSCIRFGMTVGEHREREVIWRRQHPDYFTWDD